MGSLAAPAAGLESPKLAKEVTTMGADTISPVSES